MMYVNQEILMRLKSEWCYLYDRLRNGVISWLILKEQANIHRVKTVYQWLLTIIGKRWLHIIK